MQPVLEQDDKRLPHRGAAVRHTGRARTDRELEKILSDLVAFPTVSDDHEANHAALNYVAHYLQERGMHVQRFKRTDKANEALIASTRIDNAATPAVLLAAHIDVMAANPYMFTLWHDEGKYTGRGVLDMKFAIASYLRVADVLQTHLHDYDFAILITSDEELGGRDGINGTRKFVQAGYLPKVVVLPDGGDSWQLETTSNGYTHLTLEAHGKTGHSSRPWLGENAASKLTDALHEIKGYFRDHGPETDTLNIATIKTSDVPANQIPDHASAEISIRLRHPGRLAHWQQQIYEACKRHGVIATERAAWDAISNDLNNPYVRQFADITEEVTGVHVSGFHSYAGSDARFYAEAGVPYANAYPPGGGHHGDHEWLAEESLAQFQEIVRRYIERVAKNG